jgi:citrate lyase beta subunit
MQVTAPITYLFVPATHTTRIEKALSSGAHAVIIDLEDAVDPSDKVAARTQLETYLQARQSAQELWVRINAVGTPWFADDRALLIQYKTVLAGVMLPKTQSYADLKHLDCDLPVIALIESARGLLALADICRHPNLVRLAFGSADLSRDLGCEDAPDVLASMRTQLVLHSAAAGLLAPIDGVTFSLDNPELSQADAARASRCGFGAKLCIHPSQLKPVVSGFAPTAAQYKWATNVLSVANAGSGAQRLGGEMIDKPVIDRALAILAMLNSAEV